MLSFATNFPYDSEGTPDDRPGTWGNASYDDGKITFKDVPEGQRVRIHRAYGDFLAWPHGPVTPGKYAGCLFGLMTTDAGGSPCADYAGSGCMLYLQTVVGAEGARAAFNVEVSASGLLAADNVLVVRRALFLSELGVSVHMEPSFVVEFDYEPAPDAGPTE